MWRGTEALAGHDDLLAEDGAGATRDAEEIGDCVRGHGALD